MDLDYIARKVMEVDGLIELVVDGEEAFLQTLVLGRVIAG